MTIDEEFAALSLTKGQKSLGDAYVFVAAARDYFLK